jgi:hypothetical protein
MAAGFNIGVDAYRLSLERDGLRVELAMLAGGADALLRASAPVSEATLEAAIERAEDWLMPHAAGLSGEALEVVDETGRLQPGLARVLGERGDDWNVGEIESLFLRLLDMATGRVPSPLLEGQQALVADILLLRELAHHGKLERITLR